MSFGCSAEQDSTNVAAKSVESKHREKGEIPRDRIIYDVLFTPDDYSLKNLVQLYKKDIRGAEGEDYLSNLKNTWMVILSPRLIKEGTDKQKRFFIKEQEAMDSNLPHFESFYILLASCNSITNEEKSKIFEAFYVKNKEVIESVKWRTPEEEENKMTQLVYTKRTFGILNNYSK